MLQTLLDYDLGYLGIVAFLAMCGCGIPIPEEVPLVVAGVLSSQGALKPWLAFASCLGGALLGDSIMYAIGRRLGHGWLTQHPSIERFIDADKEEKFEHAVRKHGFKVLLLTRFLVGVRGPVYYAAGAAKMPYLKFLLWDSIAATGVVGLVFGLAYAFGKPIAKLIHSAETVATAVVVVGLMLVGIYYIYKKQTTKVAAALEDITEHDAEEVVRKQEAEQWKDAAANPTAPGATKERAKPSENNGSPKSDQDTPGNVKA